MKSIMNLLGWEIRPYIKGMEPGKIDFKAVEEDSTENWILINSAKEVTEALIENKLLSDSIITDGDSRYCNWISETDWVYRCKFEKPPGENKEYIDFKGIDTVGDIFLNGVYMGQSRSMYLNFRFEASDLHEQDNVLLVYVHSHKKMLKIYEDSMPDEWRGNVTTDMMLRKSRDYGAAYGYHPIGLFDDVLLESFDKTEITNTDMTADFTVDFTQASLHFSAEGIIYENKFTHPLKNLRARGRLKGSKSEGKVVVKFTIEEEDHRNPISVTVSPEETEDGWKAEATLKIDHPRLWWPKNYGEQPMYFIKHEVCIDGELCDQVVKMTGLRHVRMIGSMKFEVNGVEIRWWGAGITPVYGLTNRYNPTWAQDMAEKIADCNMNGIRVWGPGRSYPDEFYYEFDKRGIMIWQDFPTGTWQMPDSPEYKKLYGDEAIYMIKRLKAHPCIMLWCGGNEHIYMCELDGKKGRIGFDMLHYGYRSICDQYDPQRYYHVSSPYEGRYANEPSFGDSHGSRAYCAYTPGEDYGIFFSEDIRVFPPQYKSAVKFMKEEVWDDNYVDMKPFGTDYAMPVGWKNHLGNNGHLKLGKISNYYSARNVYELIYKYAAAAAQDLIDIGAHARTGNPAHKSLEKRQCTGHMFWKFNDSWPRFYCSFYDYYQECTLPFYAVKRVFAPFLIHFEVADHIYLWGVNDTMQDKYGYLSIRIYDILNNSIAKEITFPAAVPTGRSVVITNLDEFGPIKWKSVLYAEFKDQEGNILSKTHSYVTEENMLPFPKAKLVVHYEDGYLDIKTDQFARCVELTGNEAGDEFGWYFEDNYFDLLPFETKKVKVSGRHEKGTISAKAHYSDQISSIEIVK